MNQRYFLLVFIFVLLIGVLVSIFSKDMFGTSGGPSPMPEDQFSTDQNNNPTPGNSAAPTAKHYSAFPGTFPADQLSNKKGVIVTSKGTIEFEIYPEATKAASNFIHLAQDKYFDGLVFHRVEDWVIQTGDPTGTGRGGPGYQFEDEPVTRAYTRGIVAMANAGPNTNGSQFFILKKDYPLDPNYTIFGNVTSGLDVVDKIAVGDVMQQVTIAPLP